MTGGGGGQRCRCPANAVILRVVAVSMVECRGRWIFGRVRWQAEMDSATVRRMTKLGFYGHFGNANAVILREVAVSMVECRGRWIFWGVRWQAEMDSATARRMTKLGFYGHFGNDGVWARRVLREWWGLGSLASLGMPGGGCPRTEMPLPCQRRHTARSRSIHGGVQRALDFLGGALAGGDGFCDCAQNDEVWVRRVFRECQHRHTARSRSIHSGVPRPLASPAAGLAGGDGFCDCAQNDEVWVQRALRR